MRTRLLTLVAGAACLTLVASACGGDDSEASSDASPVLGQVEAICDDWRATLDQRGDFPVDGFDPEHPLPGDLRVVGEYFASGTPAAAEAIAALRHLSPHYSLAASFETFVSALEQRLQSAKAQASAAQAGDAKAFTATLASASASGLEVQTTAVDLGVPECAF